MAQDYEKGCQKMKYVKCMQEKCCHNPDCINITKRDKSMLTLLCPVCDVCGAPPHLITEGCKNCLLCENKEGYMRKGRPKPLLEIAIPQLNKVEQIIIKNGKDQTKN